jgi:nitrogen regulatory protein P-II 2
MSVKTQSMKRISIVAEAIIAERLIEDILRLGASGYTQTAAEGRGSRGVRASEWEGRNAKIETIVRPDVADKILERLTSHYLKNFAVIAYTHDVEVIRGDKY